MSSRKSTRPAKTLPPDPEDRNDERADWAASSLNHFQRITGADDGDALSDLLSDFMHWCDRNAFNFPKELERARWHYAEETSERGKQGGGL